MNSKTLALGLAGMVSLALAAPAAAAPERSLAGIIIGRPASQIFAKYGNPTRIDTDRFGGGQQQQQQLPDFGASAAPMGGLPSPGQFGLPPTPGAPPMPYDSAAPPSPTDLGGAFGGAYNPNMTGSLFGTTPSAPSPGPYPAPGQMGGGMFGTPQQQQQQLPRRQITRYYYDFPSGTALVFTVGYKGLVEQIDAFAPWPWSAARTSRGINVGSTYKTLIAKYGYPDSQETRNDGTLFVDYSESANVAFTLLGGQVVGVSVALVE